MALTKTLWSTITSLVTTGAEVRASLSQAFSNIDDAIDAIDTNTSNIDSNIARLESLEENVYCDYMMDSNLSLTSTYQKVTSFTPYGYPVKCK